MTKQRRPQGLLVLMLVLLLVGMWLFAVRIAVLLLVGMWLGMLLVMQGPRMRLQRAAKPHPIPQCGL